MYVCAYMEFDSGYTYALVIHVNIQITRKIWKYIKDNRVATGICGDVSPENGDCESSADGGVWLIVTVSGKKLFLCLVVWAYSAP